VDTDMAQVFRPVWWELLPLCAAPAYATNKRRFFGIFTFILWFDLDGKHYFNWVHTSNLIERTE
jgi:hypothetical protein